MLAIVDIDNTVIDPSLRVGKDGKLLPAELYGHLDRVIPEGRDFVRELIDRGYKVVFLTGRDISEKPITLNELIRFGIISPEEYKRKVFLVLHPLKDKGVSNLIFKILFVKKLIEKGLKPSIWVEDLYFYDRKSAFLLKRAMEKLGVRGFWLKNENSWKENYKIWVSML